MTPNGIACTIGSQKVMLDPKSIDNNAINFVSHAHMDHLPATASSSSHTRKNRLSKRATILTSHQTGRIARLRGFDLQEHSECADGFDLVDSGHILGSRGLLFDDVFYTGDICTRDRGFLQGARIPKCRVLITECTFGLPEFDFPDTKEVAERVNGIISEMYERGVPVILMGYQLGKAQTITSMFGHWLPLYLHDSVLEMNTLHADLGISLAQGIGHTEAESRGLLEKKPWVMVSPLLSERTQFVQHMKSKYGAVTIGFSGWAKSTRFAFGRKADYSIPMSDHCDYYELVKMARQSGAQKVYTTHGFEEEFAQDLRNIGIDASALGSPGTSKGRAAPHK